MVNLVEDWKDVETYTRRLSHDMKTSSYQLRKAEHSAETKVRVGQFGYATRLSSLKMPVCGKVVGFQ